MPNLDGCSLVHVSNLFHFQASRQIISSPPHLIQYIHAAFVDKVSMYGVASLIATAIVFPLLGVVAVILRFYVRLRLQPTYVGIDDWTILLSCVLVCAQGVNQIIGKT